MTRCKSCLIKAEPLNGLCPVCGIAQNKKMKELSTAERKVRFHAAGIRLIAIAHLIGCVMAILVMPEFKSPAPMAIFALLNAVLAYGLLRFSLLAYKAATAFYFFIGIVGVISIQKGAIYIAWILLSLISLYLVGNGRSKALFERRLPGTI